MPGYFTYSFEKLDVYQSALEMSAEIRLVLKEFPAEERFDLTRQIKRSVDSIAACLAEGSGRASNADQAHFTNMAYATGLETINHLNVALKLGYIATEKYTDIRIELDKIINQLNALYKYQINNHETLKKRMKPR